MNSIALLAFLVCPAQDKDDIVSAAKKLAEAKNYSFQGVSKFDGQLPFGGGGGGGEQQIPEAKFSGSYDAEKALVMLTDTNEYVKIGKVLVTRPRAEWRVVEEQPAEGGGGRQFGRGGRGMMGMFGRAPKAPHEEFADFASKLGSAKKTDKTETVGETDGTIYEADLSEEYAKELNPMSRMLDRMGGGGEVTGKARFWIDADGNLLKIETTSTLSADIQGNAIEISSIRTITIHGVGTTKVEIPAGAKEAIDKKNKEGY